MLFGRVAVSRDERRLEEMVVHLTSELADITRDLARKGAELEAAHGRLEELGRRREEFMSIVSHDLKSSLQAVRLQARIGSVFRTAIRSTSPRKSNGTSDVSPI